MTHTHDVEKTTHTHGTDVNTTDTIADDTLTLETQPKADSHPPQKKSSKWKTFLKILFILALIGLSASGVLAFSVYQWASNDLPNFTRLADYRPPLATTVLARDGSIMGLFYNEKRFFVELDEVSPYLPKAILAVEDAEFYTHVGVNPMAILRAAIINFQSGKATQGGSTITQQVIKRLVLSPERTYERKLKEAILAYRLEKALTKDEILTIYMNQTFLGSNAYGVEAAARTYFGRHAKDLTLAQSALIAGLPQAPSAYNPYRNPQAAKTRQLHVLSRMRTLDWISEADYQDAVQEPLTYISMAENLGWEGAWYLEEVRRKLIDMFSESNARRMGLELPLYGEQAVYELGLTVQTSLEPTAQRAADKALRDGLEATDKRHGWRGAQQTVPQEQLETTIANIAFAPQQLSENGWTKAVVTAVEKNAADVRMGLYQGRIELKGMSWAREPNPKIAAVYAPAVKDATTVLKVGDVIWVSAREENKPKSKERIPYDPLTVTPDTVIPLNLQQYPVVQGALVSMESHTGDVIALTGGYSFSGSQFNRATQAKRQPGSSFKSIVYSTALDNGFTPGTIVIDAPVVQIDETTSQMWRPSNFENNFRGPMLLRTALALSRNLCTIRVAQQVGVAPIIERAHALGLQGEFPEYLSIALGAIEATPLDMAQVYAVFSNGGARVEPRFILSIKDFWGNTLYAPEPEREQVISPQNAYLMQYLLKEVVNAGTGTKAKVLERPVAGKTGTSNEERDAWFLGFTPQLVTGVYVGYDQVKPMGKFETGGNVALPIFVDYSKTALAAYPIEDFPEPPAITNLTVDKTTGKLALPTAENSITMPFYVGTGPAVDAETANREQLVEQGENLLKQLF